MNAAAPHHDSFSIGRFVRSAKSRDFEADWRALRDDKLVPSRHDFHPAKILPYLRDIVLIEVGETPRLTIRLVGTAVEARIQSSIAGRDYLDYLPDSMQDGAWRSSRMVVEHPCGLWQVSPLSYERGLSHLIEMTMLPLRGVDGTDIMVVHCNSIEGRGAPRQARAMQADPALTFAFFDIGAGAPIWVA